MGVSHAAYEPLFHSLLNGSHAVCASRRLSRHLSNSYADWMQHQGYPVWDSPAISVWQDWLRAGWEAGVERGLLPGEHYLLDDDQLRLIWEQNIHQELAGHGLLHVPAATRGSIEAWQLLHAYDVPLETIQPSGNEDVSMFLRWARRFQQQCAQQHWLDSSRLPGVLCDVISEHGITGMYPDSDIYLVGFDSMTPVQDRLLSVLQQQGLAVQSWATVESDSQVQCTSAADTHEELLAAARWARTVVEQDDSASVAVLVPDLQQRHRQVQQVFASVLTPRSQAAASMENHAPFNLSISQGLAKVPVVRDALMLMELMQGPVAMDRLSHLLRSPYLGDGNAEHQARALLDSHMRQRCDARVTLATLEYYAGRDAAGCAGLLALAQSLRQARRQLPAEQSPYHWARWISHYLENVCGWPGDRDTDSNEYQAMRAFRGVLDELSRLHQVVSGMSYGQMLGRLQGMLGSRPFQPESPRVPVQVMGLLEASGLHFTHLWVTGMDDGRWPGTARPNPFLPLALQRQLDMPHASVDRELAFCRRMTRRLLHAASSVVISYARTLNDSEQSLSPLLRDYPRVAPAQLELSDIPLYMVQLNAAAPDLDSYTDEHTRRLDTQQVTPGGTGIFKDQAACPFRANALHRLQARALELPRHGLQALDRGIILHNVLEDFWRETGDHAGLVAMDDEQRYQCVAGHVQARLQEYQRRKPDALGQRFLLMEQQRLTDLILAWLALEATRSPFRVLSPEQEHVHTIAGLPVRIRPDRVDELHNGGLALIDYKTGAGVEAKHWFGERPQEPQMPVYALASAGQVRAVAYGLIRAGTTCFNGVAATDELLPGVDTVGASRRKKHLAEFAGWPEVLDHWQTHVQTLAEAYMAGDARVDPKLPAVTCRQCQQQPFCRVYQRADLAMEEEAL